MSSVRESAGLQSVFARAFHFTKQPMSVTTLSEGRYIDVNESFLAMLGWEREAVIGHTSLELGIWASPEERAHFLSQLNSEGRVENVEAHIRDGRGRLRLWLGSAEIVETRSEQYLLTIWSDVAERRRLEREISELPGRLIRVQEEERSRIARELHDDVNQRLALLSIELEQLSEYPVNRPGEIRKRAKALWRHAQEISSDVQRISYNLHPSKLDHLGLVSAVKSLCHEFSADHGLDIAFISDAITEEIPRDISLCIFRIVQEALRNVTRHSGSTAARVELASSARELNLRVIDSGSGFEPGSARSELGLGLISMQERTRLVGGELLIRSGPSRGTQVEARLPLASSEN